MIYIYIYIQSINRTTLDDSKRFNYMFWPCNCAIISLFPEPASWLYTRRGEYLGDEISSYIMVRGVYTGYQPFICVCVCHLKCKHNHYLTLACRWLSVITIQVIKSICLVHGLKSYIKKIEGFLVMRLHRTKPSIINNWSIHIHWVCRILSFAWFPGVLIASADVSEHCSIFRRRVNKKNNGLRRWNRQRVPKCGAHKIQTPGNHPTERI